MNLEYAKELLAVDCQRIVETIDSLGGDKNLTDAEVEVKNRLLGAAQDAVKVFKHPEGSAR